jgi:hypothetical protein
MMLHLLYDLLCIFVLHWGAWRRKYGLRDAKFFGEDLKKVGKTFFQSRGDKKSKIPDKISSRLEVLKRDEVKIALVMALSLVLG